MLQFAGFGKKVLCFSYMLNASPQVGFAKRDPLRLKVAIENTYHLIWIRATRQVMYHPFVWACVSCDRQLKKVAFYLFMLPQTRLAKLGQLVGFARATSDGVLSATIWDVAVAPAWQVRNYFTHATLDLNCSCQK
jgi:hypothetical protein